MAVIGQLKLAAPSVARASSLVILPDGPQTVVCSVRPQRKSLGDHYSSG
jgi:hypothetical protein